MPLTQIILEYLKIFVWPLVVLILFFQLLPRLDRWLNSLRQEPRTPVADEAPSVPDEYQTTATYRELARLKQTLLGAPNSKGKAKLQALEQALAISHNPMVDAVGLSLLQDKDRNLPLEEILQKTLEIQYQNADVRKWPFGTLRMMQLQVEGILTALQNVSLVAGENDHYQLTPEGLQVFEKIEKEKTDFESRFYKLFSGTEPEAITNSGIQYVFSIQDGTDDASESPGPAPCPFSVSDENIYLGECSPDEPITAGLRFVNVDIPPQAIIRKAFLEFVADGPYANLTSTLIYAEAGSNAKTFNDTDRPCHRPLTPVAVSWRIPAQEVWTLGQVHTSPDISLVLQTVFNRPDWQQGNALALLIKGAPGGDSGTHRRFIGYVRGIENPGYQPPKLVIELSLPEDNNTAQSISSTEA